MSAAVCLQYPIVKMLYADAQPGDPDLLQSFELRLSYRAGLAFKSYLLGVVPANVTIVALDFRCVLVGVDFEVTEFAALAAEGDVQIKPERILGSRRLGESLKRVGNVLRFPLRERRIVRDKIIADLGLR